LIPSLTIQANISALFVDVLELPQGLDDEDVLHGPGDDQFRALVEAVVQDLESLQDVAPVLPLVVQTLVQHVHDLVELGRPVTQ
jgi:hypothetical protein